MKISESGVTLIELLISMAIFSIGILAVAALQTHSTNSNTTARMSTEATEYAQDCIEWIRSLEIDDATVPQLTEGTNHTNLPAAFNTGGYDISWDVAATDTTNNWRVITVRVNDPRGAERISVVFTKSLNASLI